MKRKLVWKVKLASNRVIGKWPASQKRARPSFRDTDCTSTETKQLAQRCIREESRIAFPAGANGDTSTVELFADRHALAQVVEEVKQKHDGVVGCGNLCGIHRRQHGDAAVGS